MLASSLYKSLFVFTAILICLSLSASGQIVHQVKGSLKDTAGIAVDNLSIDLISGKDTLKTTSDRQGGFVFKNVAGREVYLRFNGLQYQSREVKISFPENKEVIILEPIVLSQKQRFLDQVIVKAKVPLIKIKRDTTEYDAEGFGIGRDDLLEDLLKKLPNMRIDRDGNVSQAGKAINKLRVNGKDFFTGDLKAFLRQLPADIISKLQVINDFGDDANFTGIKMGDPPKMLNLVIKPGMDSGKFGNATLTGGTNKQYGIAANGNYWKGNKQISLGENLNYVSNVTGRNNTNAISASYRNQFNKVTVSGAYSFFQNQSNAGLNTFTQNILSSATIFNNIQQNINRNSKNHNLQSTMEFRPNTDNYLKIVASAAIPLTQSTTIGSNIQTGSSRQDLKQQNQTRDQSPSFTGALSWGHHFGKAGRTIAAEGSFIRSRNTNKSDLQDSIIYYDRLQAVSKDSLLHRLFQNHLSTQTYTLKVSYTEPLNKKASIDLQYLLDNSTKSTSLTTGIYGPTGILSAIDSLSNAYQYNYSRQSVFLSYRLNTEKLRLNAGINYQSAGLDGQATNVLKTEPRRQHNFSPVLNLDYAFSRSTSLNAILSSAVTEPDYRQISPLTDARNVQNLTVGNPSLKPAISNQLTIGFQHTNAGGHLLNVGLSANQVKNKIVTDVLLVADTLNSLKQLTSYRNTNGAYSVAANYDYALPKLTLLRQRFVLNFNGSAGYNNNPSFTNNLAANSQTLNLLQRLSANIILNGFEFGLSSSVSHTENKYSTGQGFNTRYQQLQLGLASSYTVTSSLSINADINKSFNRGLSGNVATSPLVINAAIKQKIFRKRTGELQLQAFDLLNQANFINRTFSDNTITENRLKFITRYFKLTFSTNFRHFGPGK